MEKNKIPFYKRVKLAIFNVEKYQEFAMEDTKIAIKYFLKLILLLTTVVCIAITYQYITVGKTTIKIINEDLPDFSFEDNILSSKAEEPTFINGESNNFNYTIIIDTKIDDNSNEFGDYIDKGMSYNLGLIFLKDKIILCTNQSDKNETIYYKNIVDRYEVENFDKQKLIDYINNINPLYFVIAIYLTLFITYYLQFFLSTIIETGILFLLGWLASRLVGIKLRINQIYVLGLYSLTLSILLNMIYIPINLFTGFEMEYFRLMYTTISYIYLITAILFIRTDLMKQQQEIEKIEDVQKEVRNEIEEKKEQEKKEKGETEDGKKDKDEEKNKDIGTDNPAPEST